MENENYDLLLEENKKLSAKIEELEKRITDVCNFNKSLLNTKGGSETPQGDNKEKLRKRLEEGLKR